jgi:hypothetical protein
MYVTLLYRNTSGEQVFKVVVNEATAHIANLVSKQKSKKKKVLIFVEKLDCDNWAILPKLKLIVAICSISPYTRWKLSLVPKIGFDDNLCRETHVVKGHRHYF